jgi:4-hydroxy-2-oxoheptanedioate aldolase
MFDRLQLQDTIHAIHHHSEGKTMCIVRIPPHQELVLNTALDAGASGIIIPHVEEPSQITEMLDWIYYPPKGKRSFSPWTFAPGVNDLSMYPTDEFNMTTSNEHVAIIAQIESVKGVQNAELIAQTPGVDGIFFGPGDYMADAGLEMTLKKPQPQLFQAMMATAAAAKKHGVPMKGGTMDPSQIPMMIDAGWRMLTVSMDVWTIGQTFKAKLDKGRAAAKALEDGAQQTNGVKKE